MLRKQGKLESSITRIACTNGETIPAVAQRLNLAHATIYRIMKGRRPESQTLSLLCREFARTPEQSAEIMFSYILDEIERAGMSDKMGLIFKKIEGAGDMRLIRTMAELVAKNNEIRGMLEYLATLAGTEVPADGKEPVRGG